MARSYDEHYRNEYNRARAGRAARRDARMMEKFYSCVSVVVVLAVLYVIGSCMGGKNPKPTERRDDTARTQIRTIENACKQFKIKYGQYPTQLTDLLRPPPIGGGRNPTPFLETADSVSDPWGHEFSYELPMRDTSQGGETRPHIWTRAPDGEVIQNREP